MRTSLSKRVRFEVFKRDGFRCTYCGQRPPEVVLVVDHVVPVAAGGTNEEENLTTSCYTCNAGKGAVPLGMVRPVVDEDAIAEAMQEIAERRILLQAKVDASRELTAEIEQVVEDIKGLWMVMLTNSDDPSWQITSQSGFDRRSIVTFVRRGLTLRDMELAMDAVEANWSLYPKNRRGLWLHFCRICWDTIKGAERVG